MPAHHGVGSSTFDITPMDSIRFNSLVVGEALQRDEECGVHRGLRRASAGW